MAEIETMNEIAVMNADPDLDTMRRQLAAELPGHAAFDGWTPAALELAASATGIAPAIARLAFPDGAIDMIDAWFAHVDRAMLERLPPATLAAMKVRARITALVEARIDIVAYDIEALRRALAVLALPTNLARALRLDWRAADTMWRAAGDTATDLNHYSKRAILGSVYAATILALLGDDSEGHVETRAFLGRRIDGIMRFEKFKSRVGKTERFDVARFIGRLRYPVQ